jgi:hypothetical protein
MASTSCNWFLYCVLRYGSRVSPRLHLHHPLISDTPHPQLSAPLPGGFRACPISFATTSPSLPFLRDPHVPPPLRASTPLPRFPPREPTTIRGPKVDLTPKEWAAIASPRHHTPANHQCRLPFVHHLDSSLTSFSQRRSLLDFGSQRTTSRPLFVTCSTCDDWPSLRRSRRLDPTRSHLLE